jgi:hypothetical protein
MKPRGRPLLSTLRKLAQKIRKLPGLHPEERAYLAALDYVTGSAESAEGVATGCPERIASLHGPSRHHDSD